MRRLSLWLVLLLAIFAPSCGGPSPEGLAATEETGGPRVRFDLAERPLPEVPLPNDVATRFDASSPTGRRVNVGLVARTQFESHLRETFDALDGFGVFAPITVSFDAPLDLAALAARHADDDFRNDAVYLLNVDPSCSRYGEEIALDLGRGRFPIVLSGHAKPSDDPKKLDDGNRLFELDPQGPANNVLFEERNEDKNGNGILDPGEDVDGDGHLDVANLDDPKACDGLAEGTLERDRCVADHLLTHYERETNTLILRPVWPLEERCAHAVVLTKRLVGVGGRPVVSPFAFVNHRDQTLALGPVPALLARYGLGTKDISFAWTFTTGTMTAGLRALREGLHGKGPWARLATEFPVESLEIVKAEPAGTKVAPGGCSAQALDYYWYKGIKEYPPNMCAYAADNASIGGLVAGTFEAPNFQVQKHGRPTDVHPNDEEELFDVDFDRGTGTYGRAKVTFWCALPKPTKDVSCTPGNPEGKPFCQPYPVSIFAHGYGSNRAELSAFLGRQTSMGMASCAVDAFGHGGNVLLQVGRAGISILEQFKIKNFGDLFLGGRDRDINDDGQPDPGADFYAADLAHTRDNLRQSVLEMVQLVRILRSMDGVRRAKDGSVFGDFDGDGVVDLGGQKGTVTSWGISLGGLITGVLGGLEPDVDATVPISGGAGLSDVTVRATVSGLPSAVFLPILGPFVAGWRSDDDEKALYPDGEVELGFIAGDLNNRARVNLGRVKGIAPGDTVVVANLDKGIAERIVVGPKGTFRVGIAADALSAYARRPLLGIDTKEASGAIEVSSTSPQFGDRLAIRVLGPDGKPKSITDVASGQSLAEVTSFLRDANFQATTYKAGAPLVAVQRGLGYARNAPRFRRFFGLAQHALDSVDSAVWSQWYYELERPGTRLSDPARQNHVLVIPTGGDTVVPVNAAIAMARTAGLFGSWRRDPSVPAEYGWRKLFVPDPRYGKSIDRWLVDTHVIENQPRLLRNAANPKNPKVLLDVDDLSEGRSVFPCSEFSCLPGVPDTETFGLARPLAPLRATHARPDGSFDAMRIPILHPIGQHGFYNAQKVRAFDGDAHGVNLATLFMVSRGRVVELAPDCHCSATAAPKYLLDGKEQVYSDEAPCENTATVVKI